MGDWLEAPVSAVARGLEPAKIREHGLSPTASNDNDPDAGGQRAGSARGAAAVLGGGTA